MNRLGVEQIDRELGAWLREESLTRAPSGLVESVFARTSRTSQASRWWPPRRDLVDRLVRPAGRPRLSVVAGALAIVIVTVGLALGPLRPSAGPGSTPGPSASVGASPGPSVTPSPSQPASSPPTPIATTLGSLPARRLDLGPDAAPIHVIEAFGSIWIANIHANDVRRFDPATMSEIARVSVDSAAWFAVADDALWVTSQTGVGVSRIDPATNTVVARVGNVPPCAAPVLAFGSLWQAACDGGVILRIDPGTNALTRTYPIQGHRFLVYAGNRLLTVGSDGLAAFDPDTGTFTPIGGGRAVSETESLFSDGSAVWVKNTAGVVRVDPADGHALAAFPHPDAQGMSFSGDHAWLAVSNLGVLEVDLTTNRVRRTIAVPGLPLLPLEAGGALWLTDFDNSVLWKVEL